MEQSMVSGVDFPFKPVSLKHPKWSLKHQWRGGESSELHGSEQ